MKWKTCEKDQRGEMVVDDSKEEQLKFVCMIQNQ
jgi:hypothetical protein